MKEYLNFTEEEFILDPAFQKWVLNPDEASNQFWIDFMKLYPNKRMEVNNARSILGSFQFTDDLSFAEKEKMWQNIEAGVQIENNSKVVYMHPVRKSALRRFAPAGAAILLGCIVFAGIKMVGPKLNEPVKTTTATTRYGEIKRLKLPDSSIITLNAHSHVSYNPKWDNSKREVWIDGEAFFSVKHTGRSQLFVVHTAMFDIEVLGTEFNVSQRRDRIKISLNSGRIKLKALDNSKEDVVMSPGELLEISLVNKHVQKKQVKVENISAWKEGRLLFDDTPLSEVIETLKDTYGWEIAKVDDEILNERISGEAEMNDEKELINTLEKALHIRMKKEGVKIYITRL